MDNSYPKGGKVTLQREFKVTVLSVNTFACTSWYSLNGQNDKGLVPIRVFSWDLNILIIFWAQIAT